MDNKTRTMSYGTYLMVYGTGDFHVQRPYFSCYQLLQLQEMLSKGFVQIEKGSDPGP